MDPTTLVTFLFSAPAEARTVELLGSWDGFTQPYRMHNDRRRGIWSGIFKFENISFDGDGVRWTKPRSGGLRQGATYWYYYRLNSYDDIYDDRQPRTLSCPMLPGQVVNIIDVPIEKAELPERCYSSHDIDGSLSNWQELQTLDPARKYVMLEPPPVSKIHARALSDGTLNGRLEHQRLSILEEIASHPPTPYSESLKVSSTDRKDSRVVISRDSSVYSRDTSCSGAGYTNEESERASQNPTRPSAPEQVLYQLPEVSEVSLASAVSPHTVDPVPVEDADLETAEAQPDLPKEKKTPFPIRKLSAMSIGPFSVQNIQFYNESRPGTMLTEDPEQYRPRVYSTTLEVKSSDEGSPQVSPMSAPVQRQSTSQSEEDYFTPDSDIVEVELGSPSFYISSISSDGEESPLRLSPQNSIKGDTRSRSRSGGAFTGFANRLRSLRLRQSPPAQEEAQGPPRLTLPSFINYSLPPTLESNHSLAKSHSNNSNQTRSAHEHMPAPTVFDADLPIPSEGEGSMADAIFSELGYLSGSIG